MRRIVLGLVVALIGAGFAGRLVSTSAIEINGQTVSTTLVRAELAVIASQPNYACYLSYSFGSPVTTNGSSLDASTVADWTSLQVQGIAAIQYDQSHYHWRMTAAQMVGAEDAYASDLDGKVADAQGDCPVTAQAAIGALPTWFLDTELTQSAASGVYTEHLSGAIPLTPAGLKKFYDADPTAFDTVCIAIVEVPTGARESAFESAVKHGESVRTLAKDFSILSTAATGGNEGCYTPSTANYGTIVDATDSLALDRFPATPQDVEQGDAYFVAATKRTSNAFAKVEGDVLSVAETENADLASLEINSLLHTTPVSINPAFGRWRSGVSSVITLARPPKPVTPNAGAGLAP